MGGWGGVSVWVGGRVGGGFGICVDVCVQMHAIRLKKV